MRKFAAAIAILAGRARNWEKIFAGEPQGQSMEKKSKDAARFPVTPGPGFAPFPRKAIAMTVLASVRAHSLTMAIAAVIAAATASICMAAGETDWAAQQARLRLTDQPANVEVVTSVQKRLVAAKADANAPKAIDVVVTGQIGGVPNVWPESHPHFPWYEGQASFFLVDSKVAAQCCTHAKQNGKAVCVFCQRQAIKNAHAVAVVNMVDEQGEVLRTDARELLGLKQNQVVTIRGKAKLLGGSFLVIDADGIYVPRVTVANQGSANNK
jgi:hypothetical protein